jgi:hypothetical protein
MFAVYLNFGGHATLKGMIALDGMHVFSIYDFMMFVCHKKTLQYAKRIWKNLRNDTAKFMELQQYFGSDVASTNMIPGTTVMGLQALMNVLDNKVNQDSRWIVEDIFARYIAGDMSMLTVVDLNATDYEQYPNNHYNFMPPQECDSPI